MNRSVFIPTFLTMSPSSEMILVLHNGDIDTKSNPTDDATRGASAEVFIGMTFVTFATKAGFYQVNVNTPPCFSIK